MDESAELKLSLGMCLGLSAIYVVYELLSTPSGGNPFGHWLGILGTFLMVLTEVLYTVRKRTNWLRRYGPVRYWLSAHIFTGIVGPFMVLTHTAFEFRGLAGITMALTALVCGSGFLGRYFYTAIPHTLAGVEASSGDLVGEVRLVQEELAGVGQARSGAVQSLIESDAARKRVGRGDLGVVFMRGFDEWRYRTRLRQAVRRLEKSEQQKLGDIERLLLRRRNLERQMRMMQAARRLLSIWHIAHVPMGAALFGAAAIHVAATFYFGAGVWPR